MQLSAGHKGVFADALKKTIYCHPWIQIISMSVNGDVIYFQKIVPPVLHLFFVFQLMNS